MKILLAIDGSTPSAHATELVATTSWPTGTEVRIVSVDETLSEVELLPWLGEPLNEDRGPSWWSRQRLARLVEDARARIASVGMPVDGVVRNGWAAPEIVREAVDWRSDLVVLGSRPHGLLENALLGSVSAAVLDRAPCPVLIARGEEVDHVLIGIDAARTADAAIAFIVRHRLFAGLPLDVVGAVRALDAVPIVPPVVIDVPLYQAQLDGARDAARAAVSRAVTLLSGEDRSIRKTIIDGPAEGVLISTAVMRGADLIVVGTRGEHGVRRLLHGSVAQGILLHSQCSVMVVHEPGTMASERRPVHAGSADI